MTRASRGSSCPGLMFSGDGEVWSGGGPAYRCKLSKEVDIGRHISLVHFFTSCELYCNTNSPSQSIYKNNNFNHYSSHTQMKNCRNVRFVCSLKKCVAQKMKGNHLLSMFSAALPHRFRRPLFPSLQIRLCSLSHFCPPENVLFLVAFALAPVKLGWVSSFFLLSPLLSSTHPLRPSKFLAALLLIRFFFFFFISLSGLEMFKSASLWEIFFFRSYVKVLSVASWNYLGAKLIALDPTSHCNRLSANLGFSRRSQVSPRQWLHQAVCSS